MPTSFVWGDNVPSKKTFDILRSIHELDSGTTLATAGALSVKDLLYWPHVDLSFLRQSAFGTARNVASVLYLTSFTPKLAVTQRGDVVKAVFEVLINDTSTVASIAGALDKLIKF